MLVFAFDGVAVNSSNAPFYEYQESIEPSEEKSGFFHAIKFILLSFLVYSVVPLLVYIGFKELFKLFKKEKKSTSFPIEK